jgi:glycosyltransferase involved in cell wall biosynthesis
VHIVTLNLSRGQGGAEVYTEFFVRTCRALGWRCTLFVDANATFWNAEILAGATLLPGAPPSDVIDAYRADPAGTLVINQTSLPADWLAALASIPWVSFAHHVITERNRYAYYAPSHRLLAVSRHVMQTCTEAGLTQCWDEPLYGVAHVDRGLACGIVPRSPYEWDQRKFRDRLLQATQRWWDPPARRLPFARRAGLTLGIVSRLADLKQFPALLGAIAPLLAARPEVALEIFGCGMYREVRRIERALEVVRSRTRFWGWQANPQALYPHIDLLLAGLPEREALGLNVIEAQMSGVPVLAVDRPPFSEIVAPGVTGSLYADPRQDGGASFAQALDQYIQAYRADGAKAIALDRSAPDVSASLRRFTQAAYNERIARILPAVARAVSA